jgi:large subunit ribosomal protein L15
VDELALRSTGLANGRLPRIKILGSGDLTKKLTVTAHAFSASAKAKIEAKGGTCEVIAKKIHPPKPAKVKPAAPAKA